MKKTFEELTYIDQLVAVLYRNNPFIKDSKFGYAYSRFYKKNYKNLFDDFKINLTDIRIKYAMEDKLTGEIILDPSNARGFKYTKESLPSLIKDETTIEREYNLKEIEIEPFFSPYVPKELSEELKQLLQGLILNETSESTEKVEA